MTLVFLICYVLLRVVRWVFRCILDFFFFFGTNSLFPFKSRKWVVLVGIHLLYLAHRFFVVLWRTILKVLGENHDTVSTARWDSRHGSIDRSHLLAVVVFSIRNDLKGEINDTVSMARWDSRHGPINWAHLLLVVVLRFGVISKLFSSLNGCILWWLLVFLCVIYSVRSLSF